MERLYYFCIVCLVALAFRFTTTHCSCVNNFETNIISGDYTPQGELSLLSGITAYDVGPVSATHVLIGITDIFGIQAPSNHIRQIADILAKDGYRVILPDFFEGLPWNVNLGKPIRQNLVYMGWQKKNSFENTVRPNLRKILESLESESNKKFGLFGFSYGGHKASLASLSPEFSDKFDVIARFTEAPENAKNPELAKVPILIVSALFQSPEAYETYCEVVNANLGKGSCVAKSFEREPGFLGSEGDWKKNEVLIDAKDAFGTFREFLCEHFPSQ